MGAEPDARSPREILADAVIQYAGDCGLQLQPWQADVIRTMYGGGQLVTRPRRNGMATVRRLVDDYNAQHACRRCDGCGQLANSEDQEPWSAWAALPPGSDLAVQLGLVKPEPCPDCKGTGVRT